MRSAINSLVLSIIILTAAIFGIALPAFASAATWYVDGAVASNGNGTSWATAWKNLTNITGVQPGDVVYISGSAAFSTYSMAGWTPINGTVANPITHRIGQDAGHNSPITITNTSGSFWIGGALLQGIAIDGNLNGTRGITIVNSGIGGSGTTAFNKVRLSYLNLDSPITGTTFQNYELDHCFQNLKSGADHAMGFGASLGAVSYTLNLIHDNTIKLRYMRNNGWGDDGFAGRENASIYKQSHHRRL